jgi:hypothetical protein
MRSTRYICRCSTSSYCGAQIHCAPKNIASIIFDKGTLDASTIFLLLLGYMAGGDTGRQTWAFAAHVVCIFAISLAGICKGGFESGIWLTSTI